MKKLVRVYDEFFLIFWSRLLCFFCRACSVCLMVALCSFRLLVVLRWLVAGCLLVKLVGWSRCAGYQYYVNALCVIFFFDITFSHIHIHGIAKKIL